ncbi:13481_t:CDS:2, partial [Acaulospora colombiana]
MSSLDDYLAKNYGTSSTSEIVRRKKKRKVKDSAASVAIIDEEETVEQWKSPVSDEEIAPVVDLSEQEKEQRTQKWKPIVVEDEAPQI